MTSRKNLSLFAKSQKFLSKYMLEGKELNWTPLELFQEGELGVWYDPSDLSTMYQDSAGTIPVVSDGDPVGRVEDKSGNGNHATQTVSTSRPVYRTNGSTHWLEFDGVDDYLDISDKTVFKNASEGLISLGVLPEASNTATSAIISFTNGTTGTSRFSLFSSVNTNNLITLGGRRLDEDSFSSIDTAQPGGSVVVTSVVDWANSDLFLRVNGVLSSSDTNFQTEGNTSDTSSIAAEIGSSSGNYGAISTYNIVVIKDTINTFQRDNLETFLAGKADVSL
jgi:hypothetical protein